MKPVMNKKSARDIEKMTLPELQKDPAFRAEVLRFIYSTMGESKK